MSATKRLAKATADSPNVASRPARAKRGSISAEQIIAGAMAYTDAHGLDALSMPLLAEHLGIGVTSIYWYFRNKNELIEALTVEAARKLYAWIHPPDALPWDESLFSAFSRLRDAMRENEVCCDLLLMRGGRASESALVHLWPGTEGTIGKLVAAGFSPHDALQNIVILSLYTRGCIVLERQMRRAGIAPDEPTPVTPDFELLTRALARQNTRGVSDVAYAAQLRAIIEGMRLRLQYSEKSSAD